jgi:uncharacterized protein
MLRQQIHDDMIAAMKAKDAVKLDAIRYVWSEIKNVEIDAKHELTDPEVTQLLRHEVKKRQEAIDLMKQGGRNELAAADQTKLSIIEAYLPQLLNQTAIEAVIDQTLLTLETKDFGSVMRTVMTTLKGQADGNLVSQIVRQKLNQ